MFSPARALSLRVSRPFLLLLAVWLSGAPAPAAPTAEEILNRTGRKGIVALLGAADEALPVALTRESELTVYVQARDRAAAEQIRRQTYSSGLYGRRIFVDEPLAGAVGLADNLANLAVLLPAAGASEAEARRVVHPGGTVLAAGGAWKKPFPTDFDDWTHHYHSPDNNPQSLDRQARAPYRLQFVAEPRYAPGPQAAVAAGGRLFAAFGHFAWHEREEPMLNTLVAINAFNGARLWQRALPAGIMVDRSTMVATPDLLYLADHESCKRLDAATGKLVDEIIPPAEVTSDRYWKWMALDGGVLYAAIGPADPFDQVAKWKSTRHGWPWTGISAGYNAPEYQWGFAKTLVAIDPQTKRVLWRVHEDSPLDARCLCMKNGRIYYGSFGKYLACCDARTGNILWRRTLQRDPEVFDAIGPYRSGHGYVGGWKSTVYMKCTDKALYVVGPQVEWLTALAADDGRVLWKHPAKDLQIVIRDDGLYVIGPQNTQNDATKRLDPLTGEVQATYVTRRRACTRSTGTCDGIFFRGHEGSGRLALPGGQTQWVSPMRPSCHVGVVIANGHLFWMPWACDCDLQLFGLIACASAAEPKSRVASPESRAEGRLERGPAFGSALDPRPLTLDSACWPTYRASADRRAATHAVIPEQVQVRWSKTFPVDLELTAPVVADGRMWLADSAGAVHSLRMTDGATETTAYTGGAVRYPPTLARGLALVGSADGCVHAFEAASGRLAWRFRAAPAVDRIPLYGALLSSWPAQSGVLVDGDTAYAAAGITDFGGTHVYALDVASGRMRWENHTSGALDDFGRRGVACQGELLLSGGRLYLAGGNAVSPGVFDAASGRCLNEAPQSMGSTAVRGRELTLTPKGVLASGHPLNSRPSAPVYDKSTEWAPMVIRVENARLEVSPAKAGDAPQWSLIARRIADGSPLWSAPLPAEPVRWGVAVDAQGAIVLVLRNGTALCLGKRG